MKSLNRYETIGIIVSITVIAVVFGGMRYFSIDNPAETLSTFIKNESVSEAPEVIHVEDTSVKATSSIALALFDSTTRAGNVTKLIVQDIQEGEGKEVSVGDRVIVHYIGVLEDGTEFDNSFTKNTPFTFIVGSGVVIEGWDKGLLGMKQGGQRILIIPSEMAYGNRAIGIVPANSTLLFAVDLLEIIEE